MACNLRQRFLTAFGLISLAVVIGLTAIDGWLLRSLGSNAFRVEMDGFGPGDRIALKAAHGMSEPAYDLALFGNSRSVMVGAEHLGPAGQGFFNFSVGGTGFLQSVSLLETLAAEGRAPKTALISLDHLELQFFGYSAFPAPLADPIGMASRLAHAVQATRSGIASKGMLLRYVVDEALTTGRTIRNLWKYDLLSRRLQSLVGPTNDTEGQYYREDGSLPFSGAIDDDVADFRLPPPLFSLAELHHWIAIKRLADIARSHGTRIIVFESPLAPDLSRRFDVSASPAAVHLRQSLIAACADEPISCIGPPSVPISANSTPWPDCCHAPAPDLGRYLQAILLRPVAG